MSFLLRALVYAYALAIFYCLPQLFTCPPQPMVLILCLKDETTVVLRLTLMSMQDITLYDFDLLSAVVVRGVQRTPGPRDSSS